MCERCAFSSFTLRFRGRVGRLCPSSPATPMDLKFFIIRQEGLRLYRAFLRLARTAPEHARGEWKREREGASASALPST